MRTARIKQAVQNGLYYLAKQQQPGGGFTSYSSPTKRPFKMATAYRTTFVPSLILSALAATETEEANNIRGALEKFLLAQKSSEWSFNYWAKNAPERQTMPYPDDLDDTFCALSALYLHDRSIVDEQVLACAVRLLLATESQVGGPYRTWLVPVDSDKVWLDVDLAVNSNVLFFLNLVSNPIPSLVKMVDQAIEAGRLASPYYPSAYPILYFIARGYSGNRRAKLLKLADELAAKARTSQDKALCLSSLIRLKALTTDQIKSLAAELLASQKKDGSWDAAAFCIDPQRGKQAHFNGAPALATALAIEALSLLLKASTPAKQKASNKGSESSLNRQVLSATRHQAGSLDPPLQQPLLAVINQVAASSNGREIMSLAKDFNNSLLNPIKLPPKFFINLGMANLYGWTAYSIYDDFLDNEGKPGLLPAANSAMRSSLLGFLGVLPDRTSWREFVVQTFNMIDAANAWELANCRAERTNSSLVIKNLPNYGNLTQLAERSMGHALAPLAVLAAKRKKPGSQSFTQIKSALAHYIIAKQLNDDAHDWRTDIADGQLTYVVTAILNDMGVSAGAHKLSVLLPKMQRKFWHHTLPAVCQQIEHHTALSRKHIESSGLLRPNNVITELLEDVEASARQATNRQAEALNFINQYGGQRG